jgi:hypothetical protein
MTLDGVPANLTQIKSNQETTKYKALISVYAPKEYDVTLDSPAKLFLISVATPEDNGQQVVDQIVSTWHWK